MSARIGQKNKPEFASQARHDIDAPSRDERLRDMWCPDNAEPRRHRVTEVLLMPWINPDMIAAKGHKESEKSGTEKVPPTG